MDLQRWNLLNKKATVLLITAMAVFVYINIAVRNESDCQGTKIRPKYFQTSDIGNNDETTQNINQVEESLAQQQYPTPKSVTPPDSHWMYRSAEVNETLFNEMAKRKAAKCENINQFIQDHDEKALQDPPAIDILKSANASRSRVTLDKPASDVELGSRFTATVTLYDGYGNRISRGGDTVRARMISTSLGAYFSGRVTDNRDGTHTATFTAMWVGAVELQFSLAYSREASRALHFRAQMDNFLTYMYQSSNLTEFSFCVRNMTEVDRIQRFGYDSVCTYANVPLFCGKPRHLECSHRKGKANTTSTIYTKSEYEMLLCHNWNLHLPKTIQLRITGNSIKTVSGPNQQCTSYKLSNLWDFDHPAGYFFRNKWISSHCYGGPNSTEEIAACLKHMPVYFLGDSTVYQWYTYLAKLLHCTIYTHVDLGIARLRVPVSCTDENRQFSVAYVPHDRDFMKEPQYPHISTFLDRIPAGKGKIVIVVHMYAHFNMKPASMFHERFHMARLSIEKLLKRRPNAKVLIKGPHTFRTLCWNENCSYTICDYFATYFRTLIQMEFRYLYDKVIFLDFLDMSSAVKVLDIHPERQFVEANIRYMLKFICQ